MRKFTPKECILRYSELRPVALLAGVHLKDGRTIQEDGGDRVIVLYDCGVQLEDPSGATLWSFEEIERLIPRPR